MNLVVKSTWTRHLVGAAVLAALAACGGGGGGSANNNTGGSTEQTASVTGVAAKGLMKFAKVVVKDAVSGAVLKETTTDATGNYTVTGLPIGTAVLIEVSSVAGTKIVDEATNAEIDAPANFTLRAAAVADAAGTANVQVTPFSEMAVAKALANGGLSKDNIEAANADVRLLVGFDVLAERPVFSDDGFTASNKAALMLAAVSRMAQQEAFECGSTSNDPAVSQAEKVKCVVTTMAQAGSSDEDVFIELSDAKDAVFNDDYDGDEEKPITTQQPRDLIDVSERGSAIDQAKALIANIRSNGAMLVGDGSTTLESRLRTVSTVIEGAANPIGDSSRELYGAVLSAANLLDEGQHVGTTVNFNASVAQVVGCRLYEGNNPADLDWDTEASDASAAGSIGCRITYSVVYDNATDKYIARQHNFRVYRTEEPGEYKVRSRLILQTVVLNEETQRFEVQDTSDFVRKAPAPGDSANGGFYLADVAIGREAPSFEYPRGYLYSMALSGDFAGGLSQVLNGFALKNTLALSITPSFTPVTEGEGVGTDTITRLTLAGSVSASGGSRPTVTATFLEDSYIESQFNNAEGQSLRAVETMAGARDGTLRISVLDAAGAGFTGTVGLSGQGEVDGDQLPTSLVLRGVVTSAANATLFDGTVNVSVASFDGYSSLSPYSSKNSVSNPQISINGLLAVSGRPNLVVNMNIGHAFTLGGERLSISGNYTQGDDVVMISGELFAEGSEGTSSIALSTPRGLGITLSEGSKFATLFKSESYALGTLDLDKSKITYADGSFEQY
ncbi:carboxypeptidase regulatory-like domain-containing protein [Aquabacterium lacunae]|uniref:Carboxypeptidase regulatory-like domain-containing protein n=1 Tax=Aquabacterium lacunae TaxID=2528630 RepID=A0A4Q9H0A2_9BURK|nr:carboxypeptidase-like regulatory domain-containing protein [Aquabacterium lacunae]TBO27968.1 carboxypeptidase regulatory-like domain-containing protein [Aquabacterium lacunae]